MHIFHTQSIIAAGFSRISEGMTCRLHEQFGQTADISVFIPTRMDPVYRGTSSAERYSPHAAVRGPGRLTACTCPV